MPERLAAEYAKARQASRLGSILLYLIGFICASVFVLYLSALYLSEIPLVWWLIPLGSLVSFLASDLFLAEFLRHFGRGSMPFGKGQYKRLLFSALFLAFRLCLDGLSPIFLNTVSLESVHQFSFVPQDGVDPKLILMVVFLVCLAMVVRYGDALKEDSDAFV